MIALPWVYDDGGRSSAGYKGHTRDCAARAAAIATGVDYQQAYDTINAYARAERPRKGGHRSNSRTGVHTRTFRKMMDDLGWEFTATMGIGTGCKVHAAVDEVPMKGPVILNLSRHYAAVLDGVVHDTHDPTRDGTRCVYGYWTPTDSGALASVKQKE